MGRARGYHFSGAVALGRILAGTVGNTPSVVALTGFEPVFQSGHVFASYHARFWDGKGLEGRATQTRRPDEAHSARFTPSAASDGGAGGEVTSG